MSEDFSEAYDGEIGHVYGFFAYRVRCRADAEDLTQRTFERALRAWKRFDSDRGPVGAWLMAIARNLLIDHYRSDPSAKQKTLDEVDESQLGSELPAADIGIEPDLAEALSLLTPRDREIVALRFGGDLTGQEIAELTNLSLANVQQILSRSLRRMRERLESKMDT